MLAMAVYQSISMVADPPLSRAGSLPQRFSFKTKKDRSLRLFQLKQSETAISPIFAVSLPPARLAALLVIGADRDRLHGRLDQAERDTQVVKPVLDFLFHRGAPFRVVRAAKFCGPFALIIVRSPTQCSSHIAMICY